MRDRNMDHQPVCPGGVCNPLSRPQRNATPLGAQDTALYSSQIDRTLGFPSETC